MAIRAASSTALEAQFERLAALIAGEPDRLGSLAPRVSRWTVGQQVEHVLKVLQVTRQVIASERPPLPRGINLTGRLALALRWFPRGVAKSPKVVQPQGRSRTELAEALAAERAAWRELSRQQTLLTRREAIYPHPYFGGLTRAQAANFAAVHTRHHLKIVDDILRAAS